MSETVVIGNATLIHGDALQVLKTLPAAQCVITDPVWPNCPPGLLAGSDAPDELWLQAMTVMALPTRMSVVMRADSDPRFLQGIRLPFFKAQILPYVMPGYIGRKLGGDELAYGFGEPIKSAPGKRVIPTYAPKIQPDGRKANGHPCSRALQHFIWLVHWWSEATDTVLDPFMGSGTTGVACVTLGRRFVGIEIERAYFDIACRRIEQAQAQGQLIPHEMPRPVQQELA